MTDDIDDWYARRRQEASLLWDELQEAMMEQHCCLTGFGRYSERYRRARAHTDKLRRLLAQAQYLGD